MTIRDAIAFHMQWVILHAVCSDFYIAVMQWVSADPACSEARTKQVSPWDGIFRNVILFYYYGTDLCTGDLM